MKKFFLLGLVFVCLVMIMGAADVKSIPALLDSPRVQKQCPGYTIIEYDKGINCHGDTIRLVRKNGFAQVSDQ